MPDNFETHTPGLSSPASDGFEITPSDDNDLPRVTRALHCAGSPGEVVVVTAKGTEITIYLAQGQVFPLRAKRVKATGTSATGLVGLD